MKLFKHSKYGLTCSIFGLLIAVTVLVWAPHTQGASHSDAPLIKQDPQANITDVYAFVGTRYNDPAQEVLNIVVSVRPFSEPGDGVIYDRFADDALYSIHITDPSTGRSDIRYDFLFSDVNPGEAEGMKNPDTIFSYGFGTELGPILSIGDARQNYVQTYTVLKNGQTLGSGLPTPPPNVGRRTTPDYNDTAGNAVSGAVSFAELDSYTQQAVQDLSGGEAVFAGPREDGFYADTPAIFDLLDPRILDNNGDPGDGFGQDGGGVDGFKGFNVLSYGVQIPIDQLNAVPGFPTVGVYASVSRRQITLRRPFGEPVQTGKWIQVNRMGNPLFNEVLVALRDKDRYNRFPPLFDVFAFAGYAENPEIAKLLSAVLGITIPDTGRDDLVSIFIPDVLRVNTSTGPVPLPGQTGFSRLSIFGGDTTGGVPSGWPNGRRIGDDVVDIALTAVAAPTSLGIIGDNVAANDQLYNQVFPYLGTPHAGPRVNQRSSP